MQSTQCEPRRETEEYPDRDFAEDDHGQLDGGLRQARQPGQNERHEDEGECRGERQAHPRRHVDLREAGDHHQGRAEANEHDRRGKDVGRKDLGEHCGSAGESALRPYGRVMMR